VNGHLPQIALYSVAPIVIGSALALLGPGACSLDLGVFGHRLMEFAPNIDQDESLEACMDIYVSSNALLSITNLQELLMSIAITLAATAVLAATTSQHKPPNRPGAPVPPILPPQNGFLLLDRAKFAEAFAADVAPTEAAFMADSQVPWGVNALAGAVSEPAWKSKRSWYLVTTDDNMIAPPVQRQMAKRAGAAVAEAKGSHAIYVSQPQAVIKLIEQAAKST
jgi:hypothetical protein